MQTKAFHLFVILALLLVLCAAPVLAQEGHPLAGSWHGNWGPNATTRRDLTVIMDWDGKTITGIVNPGFDQGSLQNAKLTPNNWTVHFEVDLKDDSGKPVRCIADGKIDKLGSDRRTLAGAWNCGATKGDFKLTRDRDY